MKSPHRASRADRVASPRCVGQLVVMLPRQRVDALIAAGIGTRFDPGHGRLMKEWLALNPSADQEWLPLAREALEFGRGKAKPVARGQ
jgi:hypothetical protein